MSEEKNMEYSLTPTEKFSEPYIINNPYKRYVIYLTKDDYAKIHAIDDLEKHNARNARKPLIINDKGMYVRSDEEDPEGGMSEKQVLIDIYCRNRAESNFKTARLNLAIAIVESIEDEDDRKIMELSLEGYSVREIAIKVNLPHTTVQSQKERIISELKEKFGNK